MKKFWARLRALLYNHVAETTMSMDEAESEVCMKVICPKCNTVFFHEHFPAEVPRHRTPSKEKLH